MTVNPYFSRTSDWAAATSLFKNPSRCRYHAKESTCCTDNNRYMGPNKRERQKHEHKTTVKRTQDKRKKDYVYKENGKRQICEHKITGKNN
jgi:hypothetical protein